jgi:predicted RND superfamily exporter protein
MPFKRVHFAEAIAMHPGRTLGLVLFITILFMLISFMPGMFGLTQNNVDSEDAWFPESELADTIDDLKNNYGSNVMYCQILVKGKNDDVLTKAALIDILEVQKQISENSKVQGVLYPGQPNMFSISSALAMSMLSNPLSNPTNMTITYENMTSILQNSDQTQIDQMLLGMWDSNDTATQEAKAQLSSFLSKDFIKNMDNGNVKAKATLMLIMFDSKVYDEIEMGDLDNQIIQADKEIVEIIDDTDFSGVEYMGVNEAQYIEYVINSDPIMGLLFLLVIIIIAIILVITYRSALDMVLSLLSILLAIIWMNAIGILLGLTFGMMYMIVPIILIGIGVDYAIHIVMRYKEGRDKERKAVRGAMLLAIATIGASLFLSALTTGVSFSSNMVSTLKPMREFGIFLLIGIFCAFFVVITFIPSVKVLVDTFNLKRQHKRDKGTKKSAKKPEKAKKHKDSKILTKVAAIGTRRPYPIIVIAIVSAIIFGYFAMQLTTEFDFREFLPRDSQLTDDISYTFDNFDFGVEEVDVLVKGDDIATSEVLSAMDETQNNIENDKHVNEGESIISILTIIQDVRTPGGNFEVDDDFVTNYNTNYDLNNDGLPDQGTDIEALFNYLRNNETYGPAVISVLYYNDGNYQGALIRVSVNTHGGDNNGEIYDELNDDVKPFEDVNDIKAYATGQPIIMHVLLTSIQENGIKALAITVIIAFVILTILFVFEFRSFSLGIMTLIPVILCICWVFGTMFIFGMHLTVLTIFVSTLTIGIGVDYGIHITNRFMESIHDFGNVDKAMKATIVNTGSALAGAAYTTFGGFIVLFLAPTDPMRMFGMITALSISFSLIASIFILPAFLGVYARRKMAKDPKYFEKHVDIKAIRDHVAEHIHDFDKNLRYVGKVMIEAEHQFAHKISDVGKEMEKAGKHIGKAAGKAGEHIGKAGKEIGKAAGKAGEHVGKAAKEAGKQVEEVAKETKKGVIKTADKVGQKIDKAADVIEKKIKK